MIVIIAKNNRYLKLGMIMSENVSRRALLLGAVAAAVAGRSASASEKEDKQVALAIEEAREKYPGNLAKRFAEEALEIKAAYHEADRNAIDSTNYYVSLDNAQMQFLNNLQMLKSNAQTIDESLKSIERYWGSVKNMQLTGSTAIARDQHLARLDAVINNNLGKDFGTGAKLFKKLASTTRGLEGLVDRLNKQRSSGTPITPEQFNSQNQAIDPENKFGLIIPAAPSHTQFAGLENVGPRGIV